MKIYIPLWQNDSHELENPYVYTLVDYIKLEHPETIFAFGTDLLWSDACEEYDIIHFMWPHMFGRYIIDGMDFKGRINVLKSKGVHIISTCHNFHAHIQENEYSDKTYDIVYSQSEYIIHLGAYSKGVLEHKYPNAKHVIILHHIYDTIYPTPQSKKECLKHIGLSDRYKYILCLGAFRNENERNLVRLVGKHFKKQGCRVLAPSIMKMPVGTKHPKVWLYALYQLYKYRRCGIITKGGFVEDTDLPFYYGASDISLIQRPEILNSGNLPMGFYMGNVVVGPNVGNVGEILRETENPVFDTQDQTSIVAAVKKGLRLSEKEKGMKNRRYCMTTCSTSICACAHFEVYKNITEIT